MGNLTLYLLRWLQSDLKGNGRHIQTQTVTISLEEKCAIPYTIWQN